MPVSSSAAADLSTTAGQLLLTWRAGCSNTSRIKYHVSCSYSSSMWALKTGACGCSWMERALCLLSCSDRICGLQALFFRTPPVTIKPAGSLLQQLSASPHRTASPQSGWIQACPLLQVGVCCLPLSGPDTTCSQYCRGLMLSRSSP
jgi:hypothetical protein